MLNKEVTYPKAKKYLGQNFLNDSSSLQKIANSLAISKTDKLLEIGPGHGELTVYLLRTPLKKLTLVEKDAELIPYLREIANDKRVDLIEGDILNAFPKLNLSDLKVTGNIPYYLTGKIIRLITESSARPKTVVFLVQKEVAERASGLHGNNLLAASISLFYRAQVIGYVSRKLFDPIPKVDSAILKLELKDSPEIIDEEIYFKILHLIFKQPRKTIFNNLRSVFNNNEGELLKIFSEISLDPQVRPENLSLENIIQLSKLTKKYL